MSSFPLAPLDHDIAPDLRLWTVCLDDYADQFPLHGLPAEDYEEAARMTGRGSGRRLLARRHALRRVLGAALGCDPGSVRLIRGRRGRPRLQGGSIDFNMGTSGGTAVIGIRSRGRVGVDVEVVRGVPESQGLVREHWTPEEASTWREASTSDRDRVFLSCWTRKEAVAKALGLGAAMRFEGTYVGSEGPVTVEAGPGLAPQGVEVRSLDLPEPLVGAVALTDTLDQLKL